MNAAPAKSLPTHIHAASTSAISNQNREEKQQQAQQHQSQSQSLSQPPLERSTGLRVPSNRKTIYDRNLNRSRNAESSRASFAYLFAEMVTYAQRRVTGVQDLERRLNEQGYPLGLRLLDLLLYRTLTSSSSSTPSNQPLRPLRIISLLQLIHGPLWRLLFSRPADALEHSVSPATPNEYMITDNDPLTNMYISVPREMGQLNCAAFVAGIVEGVCDGCGFEAKVTAHNQGNEMWPSRTVFLVRFGESVMEREKVLERAGVK
ncbi:Trafficking protein particle complex subunit 31 [Emydomyces testavorans]|uniref:Trafficking protein particle complex subunit n=1 Tax=Emydomyces testavorans TaxID=2070801 RepID=A0AAF0DLX2_9EURO|nr:Trafficking protein particle complex subunit 31 [Emydomyces testavorans]